MRLLWDRCTVSANPGGGGPKGFCQILLRGVLGNVRKSRGSLFHVFLHFYDQFFALSSLCPPPNYGRISLIKRINGIFGNMKKKQKNVNFKNSDTLRLRKSKNMF